MKKIFVSAEHETETGLKLTGCEINLSISQLEPNPQTPICPEWQPTAKQPTP
jgi:hypothetical protein